LPLWQQIKDVLYFDEATNRYVLAIIRGDLDVNETKLTHVANAWSLRMATNDEVRDDLGSEPGFISPVNFPKKSKSGRDVIIVADKSLRTIHNAYGGANKLHQDLLHINIGRDYSPELEGDIAMAQAGMLGLNGGKLLERRGIEVGNIFQLGYHYTTLMRDAEFTDQAGKRRKYYMGCYGIGIGRTLAAIVEAYHDDKGITWPEQVAPYKVYLARLGMSDVAIRQADELYQTLAQRGISVLYDDRDLRAGEKFADADLIGLPHRIVVSDKTAEQNQYEYKARTSAEIELYGLNEVLAKIR
jgi:prolyl-tRNA synthetase